jgi:hypothetical protein
MEKGTAMKIKTNKDNIIMIGVQGTIHAPASNGYIVGTDGTAQLLPQIGGITYNVHLGDSVYGWAGEAIEPGVSLSSGDRQETMPLLTLACIGNKATIVTGDAKGAIGKVIGKHVGVELKSFHVLVDFSQDVLEKLDIGNAILIRAYGQGMKILDTDIKLNAVSPELLESMDLNIDEDSFVEVPVAAHIPSLLMGLMTGAYAYSGDFDLITDDREILTQYDLLGLRLGDIVFLEDIDCSYLNSKCSGTCSVGIIVTTDNPTGGRGPGIVPLMSSSNGKIRPRYTKDANLKNYLEVQHEG